MGSSPGQDLQNPPQQPDPQGPSSPGVGMQDYQPSFQSYLPNDPTRMATGLTPQMFAPQRPPAAPPAAGGGGAPPGAGGADRDALTMAMVQAMMGRNDMARDLSTQQYGHEGSGTRTPGEVQRYIDSRIPMPQAPMAGPAGAR